MDNAASEIINVSPYAGASCDAFDFQNVASAVMAAIDSITGKRGIVLVGYSMGARLALYLATTFRTKFQAVVSISGSAGIPGVVLPSDAVHYTIADAGDKTRHLGHHEQSMLT